MLYRGVLYHDAASVAVGDAIVGDEVAVDTIWAFPLRSRFAAALGLKPSCFDRGYAVGGTLGLAGICFRCQLAGAADAAVQ